MLPDNIGWFGAVCEAADFTVYDGKPCVEAMVRLGLLKNPYTLVLSYEQAIEADIIERVGETEHVFACRSRWETNAECDCIPKR
jgi:hypothetical protein